MPTIKVGREYVSISGDKYGEVDRLTEKKSRHVRRSVYKAINDAKEAGYSCPAGYISSDVDEELHRLDPENEHQYKRTFYTKYNPRNSRGPAYASYERWYKSPIEGVTISQIQALAQCRFHIDDEKKYRMNYEVRRVLEMSAEEIEVELMMYTMGS